MPNDENFGYRKVPIEYRRSKFIRTDGISQEMPAPKDWTNDLTVIVESTNRMDGSFEEDQKMAQRHRKFVNCTSTVAKIRYGGLDNAADQIGRFRPPYCFILAHDPSTVQRNCPRRFTTRFNTQRSSMSSRTRNFSSSNGLPAVINIC